MVSRFLLPTRTKLALLVPGIAFILLELLFEPAAVRVNLPGLLVWASIYYLAAATAVALRDRGVLPPRFSRLVLLAILLAALDQAAKLLILRAVPRAAERALIPGALALTHVHNLRGSWLLLALDLDITVRPLLIAVAVICTILALALYRYYTALRGPGLWPAVALVTFVAAMLSAFVDLAIRGFTVDYLEVANLVVADLKDFYLQVALAALCAELAENGRAAWRMSTREALGHVWAALRLGWRSH